MDTLEVRVEIFICGLDHYLSDCMVDHVGEPIDSVLDLALSRSIKGLKSRL